MKLNWMQRDALGSIINICDAIGYDRVTTIEELKERCEENDEVDFIAISDLAFEILTQDESEAEEVTAYDYDADAVKTIKQVIKDRPEFDINELLYNADEVADLVDEIIFDEESEKWEQAFKSLDSEGQEKANADALGRFNEQLDLVAHVVGDTCNENAYLDWMADGEYYHIDWMMRRYFCTDSDNIRKAIDELIDEYDKQD